MKKMKNSKINQKLQVLALAISISIAFTACKEDEPKPDNKPVNQSELITTVKLIFTDSATGSKTTAIFKDLDGEGGNAPSQFDTIQLAANKSYTTQILLLDESKTAVDTISNEVMEENDEHLFVFTKTGVNIIFSITDKDANNLPVGLSSIWRTSGVSTGTTTVTLKHQPDGIKNGTAAPGETDVEVTFPCMVK